MNWIHPSALTIAGVASIGAVALHFIARSRPQAESLPTARFIPDRPVRARARALALSDVALLALRVAAILAVGAAVAGPIPGAARGRVTRVIAADRSNNVAQVSELRDSVRSLARAGDVIIAFDTSIALVNGLPAIDSLQSTDSPGAISTALAVAFVAAQRVAEQADSVELVIVSPFGESEFDAATLRIRERWPGRIRLAPLGAARSTKVPRVAISSVGDDPVLAAVALSAMRARSGVNTRVVRGQMTAADSSWAMQKGNLIVHWPATIGDARWMGRSPVDTSGGIASMYAPMGVVIGRFPRIWMLSGAVVARWIDGTAAAVEHATGEGCIRDVGILVDPAADLALRASFRTLLESLLSPCGGYSSTGVIDEKTLTALAGKGPLVPTKAVRRSEGQLSPFTPWLIALGAVLLIVELAVRRTQRGVA